MLSKTIFLKHFENTFYHRCRNIEYRAFIVSKQAIVLSKIDFNKVLLKHIADKVLSKTSYCRTLLKIDNSKLLSKTHYSNYVI